MAFILKEICIMKFKYLLNFWFLSIYDSLEQPTFGDATTGFHAQEKWAQKFHTDDARLLCSG